MRLLLAVAALTACEGRATITSCDQDLGGEYAVGDRRWIVMDHGEQLEIYPAFPDVPASNLEVAPRTLELWREDGMLRGKTHRRYMQGAASCTAKVSATIARCANNTLEIVHAETSPPLSFAPCTWGRTEPAQVERWMRR